MPPAELSFIFLKTPCYNFPIMFATEGTALLLEIIIGVFTILSGIAFSIKWLVKHYFAEIKAEFKPNSGSSMKDAITRLEADVSHLKDHMLKEEVEQNNMQKKLDHMYEILLDFVAKNSK